MNRRVLFSFSILLLLLLQQAEANTRAWLEAPRVAAGDTVRLTIAHDGQTGSRPDLTPLKQEFDIVGQSTSSRMQIANGHVTSVTQIDVSLSPKHSGQLVVPPITWDNDRTIPLTLMVSANAGGTNNGTNNAGASNGANDAAPARVFMETETDTKSPYVQAAVHLTVRVYAAVPLTHADLDFADTDAALVRQVGSDTVSNVEKNGVQYQVVSRQYILFPQHSGQVNIQGPLLSGNVPDRARNMADPFSGVFGNSPFAGMMGTTKPIRIHADAIALNVLPRPATVGSSYWLPAHNVTLKAHWNPTSLESHVGDPITLELQLEAEGLTAAQLPDLSTLLNLPAGLKAYPDQPALKDTPHGADIVGSRNQSIALIADQPGRVTLPELHLTWWDTRANQERDATLPAQTLTIKPAAGSANVPQQQNQTPAPSIDLAEPQSSTTTAAPTGNNDRWKWISLGLAILWLATLAAWLLTRRRRGARPHANPTSADAARTKANNASASQAKSAFQAACRANDAPAARRNLLAWANAKRPDMPVRGLSALAKWIDNPEITNQLQALDRACYAQGTWDGTTLANALPDLPLTTSPGRTNARELAPLYR